jgi:hypothetical protein
MTHAMGLLPHALGPSPTRLGQMGMPSFPLAPRLSQLSPGAS